MCVLWFSVFLLCFILIPCPFVSLLAFQCVLWPFLLLCVSLCVSLHYLTCPFPSSLTLPVPDPLDSVSVYLVYVLHSVYSVMYPVIPSTSFRLSVIFSSVSYCVFPIGMFWRCFFYFFIWFELRFSVALCLSCFIATLFLVLDSILVVSFLMFCCNQLCLNKACFCFPPILPPIRVCMWVHLSRTVWWQRFSVMVIPKNLKLFTCST